MDLDERLPTLLKKQNIARIEGDRLLIGDRRRYPWELSFVTCSSVGDIARAIGEMVTQGGGPLQVALTTMRFVARKVYAHDMPNSLRVFTDAALNLAAARPTNTTMARTLRRIVADIAPWYSCTQVRDVHGHDVVGFVDQLIDECERAFDADYDVMSEIGSSLIADGEGILTTCFAEHSFILSLVKARDAGKRFTVYVPETRPYLQGARLTAPALDELGIDAYLITDGMGVHFMESKAIGRYMSAADLVAMDGTVVNKVGTLANAVGARYYGIPYHVFAMSPDATKRSKDDIVMEMRPGSEILRCNGNAITLDRIRGLYPAFDCIDPTLVDAIITPRGLCTPDQVRSLHGAEGAMP